MLRVSSSYGFFVAVAFAHLSLSASFVYVNTFLVNKPISKSSFTRTPSLHLAGRKPTKRRRRKKTPSPELPIAESNEVPKSEILDDVLPDFDIIGEDGTLESSTLESSEVVDLGDAKLEMNDPKLMEAMRGTPSPGLLNLKSVLAKRDRSVEDNFEFDPVETPLPRLAQISEPRIGKKRARTEVRRANAAAAAEVEAEEEEDFFSRLPSFLVGFVSGRENTRLKILENATWFGIFSLIAWEFYINSPLFGRTEAPIPVVY